MFYNEYTKKLLYNESDKGMSKLIQWHPAFYGGLEWELREYRNDLIYETEHELSKKPLRMDMLIIKKESDVVIDKSIARFFKRYNIIEYKSPDNALTIDDLYKTIGYAYIYKGLSKHVNEIPADEITISVFRYSYPREMFEDLKRSGADAVEEEPGIFLIKNLQQIPLRVIVIKRLDPLQYNAIKALRKSLGKDEFKSFILEGVSSETQGDSNNFDAVLDAVLLANPNIIEKMKEDKSMGAVLDGVLDEIMKDKYEMYEKRGREEGMECGIEQGIEQTRVISVKNLMKNLKLTAEQAMDALGIQKSEYSKYMRML